MQGALAQLALRDITKNFQGTSACLGIELAIQKGELFYLLGPSGCGKSTLLNLIAGLLHPDSGDITLDGQSLLSVPPHRRPIHTIFQNYALFPHLSVYQNVGFSLKMRGVNPHRIDDKTNQVLSLVNLSGFESRYPHELSGGQQQRVAIARAIVDEPAILLLDEPFGALDAKLRDRMQLELKRLQRQLGTTFICVSHDQSEALSMADRIAVMNKGKIEQIGTPEEIYMHPCSRFVAEFIGETNIFSGTIISENSESYSVQTVEGLEISSIKSHALDSKEVYVSIRPERIEIFDANSVYSGGVSLQGKITEILYTGRTIEFLILTERGLNIKASCTITGSNDLFSIGQRVTLAWQSNDVVLIPKEL